MKVGNDHQFSDVFQRYRKRPVAWNSLRDCLQNSLKIKETSPNTFTQIIFRFKQVLGTPLNSFVSFFRLGNFNTVWKVAKYGVFSGPYFPVFGLSKGKYGPENSVCGHLSRSVMWQFILTNYILNYLRARWKNYTNNSAMKQCWHCYAAESWP